MALRHRCIYRDNYCRIHKNDYIGAIYPDINDHNIDKFLVASNSYDKTERNNRQQLYEYILVKIKAELGLLFSNAYTTKNYDLIEKYITDNNVPEIEKWTIKIIQNKTAMRYILLETIQDNLNVTKYVLRTELNNFFKRVFPYCLKKYTVQYINDFFIVPK